MGLRKSASGVEILKTGHFYDGTSWAGKWPHSSQVADNMRAKAISNPKTTELCGQAA